MDTKTYKLHPVLHEVNGPELLKRANIVVPVVRPGHWACLWIDTKTRAIKYIDSYFQGGVAYARAMRAYLMDLENILGTKPQQP